MKKEVAILIILSVIIIGFVSIASSISVITGRVVEDETEPEENITAEPTPTPEECAASISINFDQDVYNKGDSFEITVEVLDSQGNPIPNYNFYIKMYDNMWQSASLQ